MTTNDFSSNPQQVPASAPAPAPAITGPLSVGDLLDRIFRVYRARFGVLVLTAAALLIPVSIVNGLVTGRFMAGYFDFLQTLAATPTTPSDTVFGTFAVYAIVILGIGLLGGLASSMVNLAVSVHVLRFYDGQLLTLGEAVRRAWPRLWHLILLYLVQALAIFTVTAIIAFAVILLFVLAGLALGGAAMFLFQESDVGGPLAAVGIAVFFICGYAFLLALIGLPILYLSARWIVSVPALVNEELGPLAALRRSWRLTVRNVWRSVFYLVLLFILSSLVVSIPLAVIQQVLMLLPIPTDIAFAVSTAIGSLFSVVWQPLYATGLVLLYFDLRVRRESYDLEQQVMRLENELVSEAR